MWNYLQTKWQSLIFRLLFYFFVSILALAIVLATSFTRRLMPHVQNDILPNVERYIEYLIDDIGIPPNLSVAQQLANELPFEIRIKGKGINWASSPKLRTLFIHDFKPAPKPYDNVYFSHHRHHQFLLIQKQGYQYLFAIDNNFRRGSERRHWVLFIALGSILFLLYYAIRRLFRPIGVISKQVKKIGEGDLTQTTNLQGKDELALLAAGINRMAEQIEAMLESKSSLLLAISHELRSPITRMRVNLELLDKSEIQQQLIDDIREMETLVAAILESEKLNRRHAPLSLSRCNLLNLIEEIVQLHPCRNRIKTNLSPVTLNVDPLRIKLLIKNLLDNACHYSNNKQDHVDINLFHHQPDIVIEVQDRGIGIAAKEIPRLTEAFYRPDQARQRDTGGYGLGLYLCKLIVEAHDGQLIIESIPKMGTKIMVRLPFDNHCA